MAKKNEVQQLQFACDEIDCMWDSSAFPIDDYQKFSLARIELAFHMVHEHKKTKTENWEYSLKINDKYYEYYLPNAPEKCPICGESEDFQVSFKYGYESYFCMWCGNLEPDAKGHWHRYNMGDAVTCDECIVYDGEGNLLVDGEMPLYYCNYPCLEKMRYSLNSKLQILDGGSLGDDCENRFDCPRKLHFNKRYNCRFREEAKERRARRGLRTIEEVKSLLRKRTTKLKQLGRVKDEIFGLNDQIYQLYCKSEAKPEKR